jgi:hypothetical protein
VAQLSESLVDGWLSIGFRTKSGSDIYYVREVGGKAVLFRNGFPLDTPTPEQAWAFVQDIRNGLFESC